jgi:hypothetical protein
MANCHNLFQEYNTEISIPKTKKDKMSASKDGLRKRIRDDFKKNHPEYEPKFHIQGSASPKMRTGIRTKDDICDLDDGVYFLQQPDVTATTLQTWVKDAAKGYTDIDPEHRKKCIRNIFVNDYEIDQPIYYKVDGRNYQLAVKDTGWEDSDPKALIDWFHKRKDKNGQLVKTVKYLKGWSDNIRNKMPSGLVMTILASNAKANITYTSDRDDITLRDTLKNIKASLDIKFECIVPVVPGDDLFKGYDKTRKDNFLNALQDFIDDANSAINEDNEKKASKLWQKHLGSRFPDGIDNDESKNKSEASLAALKRTAIVSQPWAKI